MDIASLQAGVHDEDETLAAVRARVAQAVSVPDLGVGALVAHLAAQHRVRHAVVVGSAGGVTTAWLLDGMVERGIVTCIEPDGRRHALMADALGELRLDDHVRLIQGDPVATSERLSDGNYDMVVVQDPAATTAVVAAMARLLRPGGILVARDAEALDDQAALSLAEAPWGQAVVLDVDGGLVIVVREHDDL